MLINQVKDLYLKGETITEILKITNKSRGTIINWLKNLGIYNRNRDYKKHNYTNLDFFHEINTEEKAYWLGFIYADGNIFSNKKTYTTKLTIDLNVKDKNHLQKFANIFNKIVDQFPSSPHLTWLVINNKQLYTDLLNHGIEERKTYALTTNVLDYIPDNLMNHFIRGYFDGDGCIYYYKTKRKCKFLLYGTKDFLIKIQIIMKQKIEQLSETDLNFINNIFELRYEKHDNIRKIFDWLYKDSTVWLERKREKFEDIVQEISIKDRIISPYKGVRKQALNETYKVQFTFNKKQVYIKSCKTELEAAYWHDLEQVKLRGKDALYHMNFPTQFEQFQEWIQQGY